MKASIIYVRDKLRSVPAADISLSRLAGLFCVAEDVGKAIARPVSLEIESLLTDLNHHNEFRIYQD